MTRRRFRAFDYPIFGLLTLAVLAAVAQFAERWFAAEDVRANVGFWVASVLVFGALLMYAARWLSLPLMRTPVELPPPPGLRVAVATTFVPGSEPLEMLEETLVDLVALDYPHDTWVLDEGDSPEVRELCRRVGARHFTRKPLPRYQESEGTFQARTKHGNYNAWLHEVGFDRYDVVAAFDPDHLPRRDYLLRLLGFFRDRSVAYVQAAQTYYNQPASFVARGAAEETYAYYSSTQMALHASGYPIVIGCHNLHRVAALRDVGGFAAHDADDLLLTMLYRAQGWTGVYVPRRLAAGLTPVDWDGYLKQQRRWARSVLDVKLRRFPRLAGRLPPRERTVALFHGLYYLNGLATGVALALLAAVLVSGQRVLPGTVLHWQVLVPLVGALLACDLYRHRFYLHPREEAGLHWRAALLRYAKWPHMVLALADVLRARPHEYAITLKVARRDGGFATAPHLLVASVLVAASLAGMWVRDAAPGPADAVAAVVALVSLVIVASGLRRFPAPFDRELALAGRRRLVSGAGSTATEDADAG